MNRFAHVAPFARRRLDRRLAPALGLVTVAGLLLFAAGAGATGGGSGSISLTAIGTPYSQDFNTLSNTTGSTTNNLTINGWFLDEQGSSSRNNGQYAVDNGGSNTGDTYSYGTTSATERAFGDLQSGTLTPTVGAQFTNETGRTIGLVQIAYTGEQWRFGQADRGIADSLDFQVSTSATSLITGTWTDVNALDFTAPVTTGAARALDGNDPANRVARNATFALTVAPGATFWIRWASVDVTGADDGLAVDDFSLTPIADDAAPTVQSTSPASGASNVPVSSNISITFSEPVNVTGSWFTISCSSSDGHSATVSDGPMTFTLDPDTDFVLGDSCTVTILAANVTDQDADDPPDNMESNYVFTFTTPPVPSSGVVVSEVYGGGGNAGATLKNDFIELYNPTASAISLAGWSVQYASATGTTWQVTPLTGSIPAGRNYLVQEAAGTGGTVDLPPPDATGTIPMAATAGKVALVSSTTALSGSCPTGAAIVDFVGYGTTANCFEGTGPAPAPSNTTSDQRNGGGAQDTDDNAADFVVGAPDPRASADQAPTVLSTTPANNASGVALTANITITLSEPVDVTGTWFTIGCATSGSHAAAVSGGPTTFTLDPATDFATNESCTVTIVAANVSDQDTDDPPDNMAANYVFTFQTADVFVCGDPATKIHDVQGSGSLSPIAGQTATIEGVVVGDYQQAGGFGGFYVQEEDADADADPATSEGIFVFSSLADVSLGDAVRVRGTVTDFASGTSRLTELTSVNAIATCSTGNALPAATNVTLPVATMSDFERYEGMRVHFSQTLTATETFTLARFGEVRLAQGGRLYTPTAVTTPGAAANALANQNLRRSFVLDDGDNQQNIDPTIHPVGGLSASNTLRSGYTTDDLSGVFDERFSTYRMQPTGPVPFAPANPRTPAPAAVGGNLKVASFNVLNFFNGNGTHQEGAAGGFPTSRGASSLFEFNRQLAKEVSALKAMNADIVGLMELENDAAPQTQAIQDLVDGLNAEMGAGTYAFINTGVIGTDEIRVALIYKPAAVTPVGPYKIIDSSVDPRFIDTKNRPSLAQTFEGNATGAKLTVLVNHLKSKGSDCNDVGDPDTGDGQGNCNLTRKKAAEAIVDWLASDPTGSGDPDVLLIGDMNSYTFEDPITAFTNGGFTNLVRHFGGLDAYSYVFDGQSGYLDHALASSSLAGQATDATDWHINADEPIGLDYNVEFKTPNQVNTFYAPDAYRSSDHDPVVIGLQLKAAQTIDFAPLADKTFGDPDFTVSATASSGLPVSFSAAGNCTVSGTTVHITGVGTCTITASQAGNADYFPAPSVSRSFNVAWPFTGFFAPVANPPTLNVVQAGAGVPVKFSLGGDRGLAIFAAGYPKSVPFTCASAPSEGPVNQTVTAGQSSLSYDPVLDQYTYTWKTEKAWAGTCRELQIKLVDNTLHTALFKFKK